MLLLGRKQFGDKAEIAAGSVAGMLLGHGLTKRIIRKRAEKKYDPEAEASRYEHDAKEVEKSIEKLHKNKKKYLKDVNKRIEDLDYFDRYWEVNDDDNTKPANEKEMKDWKEYYKSTASKIRENPDEYRKRRGEFKSSFNPKNAIGGVVGGVAGGLGTYALKKLVKKKKD